MRVVITGATGNVGTSLVQALGDDPETAEIVGVARRRPTWSPPKTTWRVGDVSEVDLAAIFDGADAVVHLASLFQPTHRPMTTWRSNVLGSIRVFDAVAAAHVPTLVHASSVGAYAPRVDDRAVDESWPTHSVPTSAYGREKSYVERVLDAVEHAHPDLRVVRLRPAFTFKAPASPEQLRIFGGPLLPGRLIGARRVPAMPDLPGLRFQAVHAEDVAEAYRLALTTPVRGAFNVAADPVLDARRLAQIFECRTIKVPAWPVRAAAAAAWHLRLVPADPALTRPVPRPTGDGLHPSEDRARVGTTADLLGGNRVVPRRPPRPVRHADTSARAPREPVTGSSSRHRGLGAPGSGCGAEKGAARSARATTGS